jgi:uncharacterized tellurite resistance protein B-like protein
MAQEAQTFLQAEESAERLVDTLTKLRDEAVSFKTSTSELNLVREKLVALIGAIGPIAKDTHESVVVLKSIGGPELLSRVSAVSDILKEHSQLIESELKQLAEVAGTAQITRDLVNSIKSEDGPELLNRVETISGTLKEHSQLIESELKQLVEVAATGHETHDLVNVIKSVDGPELLSRVNAVYQTLEQNGQIRNQEFRQMRWFLGVIVFVSVAALSGVIWLAFR